MRSLALFLVLLLPTTAKAGFGMHAGGHFNFGSMGGEMADIYESRSMGSFDLQALPGFRFMGNSVLAGLMLEYRIHSQLTSGTSVDFSGQGLHVGLGGLYENSFIKLLLGWDLRVRHSTSRPDATYKGSGFRLLLGYKIAKSMSVDLQYVSTKFKSRDQGGRETGLGASPVGHGSVGFGLSWTF